MKTLSNVFILATNELEWKKILLIYSTYSKKFSLNYDWNGPIQYFRIGYSKEITGWDCATSKDKIYQKEYLRGHSEININDFLNNY